MKMKHLCILAGIAAIALAFGAANPAVAACDSCVSHALPTQTTAYYAPGPVARTAYYAPAATAYTTYYRPRWWNRWWRAPRATFYPTTAAVRTAYYAPAAVAAPACSTCAPRVSYMPQTSYKVQVVNRPVTTMQPTTLVDGCTGCARTVMRPVTSYVQQYQYVPTTVYRPTCSTGCSTGCSTCVSACPANCTGCDSCAGGAATIQTYPAAQQQGVPTEADKKPELRMKPVPEKEADDAHDHSHKKAKVRANDFPRLNDPNDRTAQLNTRAVRRVSWEQTAPAKKPVTHRQVGEGGWYSAK